MPQRIEAVVRAERDPREYLFDGVSNKVPGACMCLKEGNMEFGDLAGCSQALKRGKYEIQRMTWH